MKIGAFKKVEQNGRIVIPKGIKDQLGFEFGTNIFLHVEDDKLIIQKVYQACKMCGCPEVVDEEFPLCKECLEKAKKFEIK